MGSLMDQILLGLDNTKQGKLTPAKDIPSKSIPTQKAGSPPSEPPKKKSKTTYHKLPQGNEISKVYQQQQQQQQQHSHSHSSPSSNGWRKPPSPSRESEVTSWRKRHVSISPPHSPPQQQTQTQHSNSTTGRISPDKHHDKRDSGSSALASERKGSSPIHIARVPSPTSSSSLQTASTTTKRIPSSSPSSPPSSSAVTTSTSPSPSSSSPDELQLPVCRTEPRVVRNGDETAAAIRQLKKATVVAIDCEAVGMSRHGRLCLVQVATKDSVYLFDIVEGGDAIFDRGLRWLLESSSVLKIVHDCRGDSEILFYKHQVSLSNVIDTQVAFCVVCRQQTGSTPLPCALNTLIKKYARGATNTFKDIVRDEMEACSNYWEIRPMSNNMIQYASQDVIYLPFVWSQLEAALSFQSKKIVSTMSIRYLNQYRSMEERPAPPPKTTHLSPTKERSATEIPIAPSIPMSPSSPTSTPTEPSPTPTTGSSTPEAPSLISPLTSTSPRFVPKYGIEEWDRSVAQNLEMGSFRGSRGNFSRRRD